jgi:hypothetical protein
MAALAEARGFEQVFGSAYRPQSQGCVERFNQTLKHTLHAHMTRFGTRVWADMLQLLLDNYNSSVHASTRAASRSQKLVNGSLRSQTTGFHVRDTQKNVFFIDLFSVRVRRYLVINYLVRII